MLRWTEPSGRSALLHSLDGGVVAARSVHHPASTVPRWVFLSSDR